MNTTDEFRKLLGAWRQFPAGYRANDDEYKAMIAAASDARTADGWEWLELMDLFKVVANLPPAQAKAEAKRCEITADLGCYPHTVQEFVPAWLERHGYTMSFAGGFLQHGRSVDEDRNTLGNDMKLWTKQKAKFDTVGVDLAFDNFIHRERVRICREKLEQLRFDPLLDPGQSELDRMVRLILAPRATEEETEEQYKAARIAFSTMIYRTKNHMGRVWKSSAHLMPILFGQQGDGKSELIKRLCSPLGSMFTSASFRALEDKSMNYQLSIMPVMLFEEMQGIGKADIESLKAVMTDSARLMREAYARASVREIVTTFVACSNTDISNLIRDTTGNRRFIQFETQWAAREDILALDATKIWRSVDENAAEPPLYASTENTALIQKLQEGQRHQGTVEVWLTNGRIIHRGQAHKALTLYGDSFRPFLTEHYGATEVSQWTPQKFAVELAALARASRFGITAQKGRANATYYTIPEAEGPRLVVGGRA